MPRLIDADALERAVMFLGEDSICNDCAYEFVNLIDEQPTIEAEPVRRGKYIDFEHDGYYDRKCSECGCIYDEDEPFYKFCPDCGAKMEVEADETD